MIARRRNREDRLACPKCGHTGYRVLRAKSTDDRRHMKRRLQCTNPTCSYRYATTETPDDYTT